MKCEPLVNPYITCAANLDQDFFFVFPDIIIPSQIWRSIKIFTISMAGTGFIKVKSQKFKLDPDPDLLWSLILVTFLAGPQLGFFQSWYI